MPDLPGCVAVGESAEVIAVLITGALAMPLRGMREDGEPIPPPTSTAIVVEVADPVAA